MGPDLTSCHVRLVGPLTNFGVARCQSADPSTQICKLTRFLRGTLRAWGFSWFRAAGSATGRQSCSCLLGCSHHLLFIDVEVLLHELQGLLAATELQRVWAQDRPVLVHGSHVVLCITVLWGARANAQRKRRTAEEEEESRRSAGSRHNADHKSGMNRQGENS